MDTNLRFSRISSDEEFKQLGQFRLENYRIKKSYMLQELDANGLDALDKTGMVFVAWLDNKIIGTMRLCPYPFETSRLLDPQELENFLEGDVQNYLELSRLLLSHSIKKTNLLFALMKYICNYLLNTTNYSSYFGYSTPIVRKLFTRFGITSKALNFTIPSRGTHSYYLLKGDILHTFHSMAQKEFNASTSP